MGHACRKTNEHVLTEGGLVRALKLGRPEQTMHLWWSGAFATSQRKSPRGPKGERDEPGEFLIEIELLRIEGDSAVVRLWAPDEVTILSAKKDPHCQAGSR